jgi:putative oxidoreductase
MAIYPYSRAYEKWAPVVARVVFGCQFLMGAFYKLPGTAGFAAEAGMTAAAGVPLATPLVALAFVLEVVGGLALILGWHARRAAFVLAIFTVALGFIFYNNWSDPMTMGMFISHLGLAAGLVFVSVYGAKSVAISRD